VLAAAQALVARSNGPSAALGLAGEAPRQALMGAALLWCGYAFFRGRLAAPSRLATVAALGWWLWGLNKLARAAALIVSRGPWPDAAGPSLRLRNAGLQEALSLVDVGFYLLLALAMVLLLVAERRRAVRAVADAEERYRAFVHNGMEGVWRSEIEPPLDTGLPVEEQVQRLVADARLAECNDAFAAMYGCPDAAAMVGSRVWAYCDAGDAANLETLRAFVRSGYRQTAAESREVDAAGRPRLFLNSRLGVVVDGRLVRVWGTQLDVTEQARLQVSLRRAETMSALGTLVAGVAHEVRNPLFSMSATLDAFEARHGLREEYRPHLDVLRAQLQRLTRLMRDLLEYGKPASLDLVVLNPDALLRQAEEACEATARDAQVRIDHGDRGTVPALRGDRTRLVQVFTNVVENALQHSPPGSVVRVETAATWAQGAPWVEVRVHDAGPGFAEPDLARVFEPFFTKRRGGTGLGLSLVQRIVEQHGGEVTARNHPSGGAEVSVRLPAVSAASPAAAGSEA
jgi:signal transduction histidine kinase